MKSRQVLVFLLGVFSLLGAGWLSFPADGVEAGPLTLRFPSFAAAARDASESKVDVDSVLLALEERFRLQQEDTLSFYRIFLYGNPDRIWLPDDDYTFFDPLFERMENAHDSLLRVIHYGDSQIEMDRMSMDLRDALQERFGGIGTGMFPALSNVPSASISRVSSGGFVQYTMYGDSTTQRAGHNRYGPLAQVVQLSGGGTINLRATKSKTAPERTKTFSSISVLFGRAGSGFSVKVTSDTLKPVPSIERRGNATLMSWNFSRPVEKARIVLSGNAEIYGVSAHSPEGIALDNVPLRGCSGTIFTRISKSLMADCMEMENVGLIILQYGGNYMPVASSSRIIESYCSKIADQIRYFHEVAPEAKILFVGPSDMGTSRGGRIVSRPRLEEMVDSLKATALRNDAAFWDIYRMMGGENSMVRWVKHNPPYAGADYTHFTPAGAQKVGQALSRALLTCYDFYDLRKSIPEERVKAVMEK